MQIKCSIPHNHSREGEIVKHNMNKMNKNIKSLILTIKQGAARGKLTALLANKDDVQAR